MLKIKDNVDLKELEKFGFKRIRYVNDIGEDKWEKIKYKVDYNDNLVPMTEEDKFPYDEVNWVVWKNNYLWISEYDETEEKEYRDREILTDGLYKEDVETLYDLIKAGLVEKVDD